jgi:hypothetical protein
MAVRASKIAVAVPIGRPHLRGGGSGVLDSRVSQGLTAKRAPLLTETAKLNAFDGLARNRPTALGRIMTPR